MSILAGDFSISEEQTEKEESVFTDSSFKGKLQVLLVRLDHLLDHLAADRAGLAGSQVTVIAFLQVDANLL